MPGRRRSARSAMSRQLRRSAAVTRDHAAPPPGLEGSAFLRCPSNFGRRGGVNARERRAPPIGLKRMEDFADAVEVDPRRIVVEEPFEILLRAGAISELQTQPSAIKM